MATEKTDVVIVGVGAAGAVLAAELTKAGMKVTALERGPRHATADFAAPQGADNADQWRLMANSFRWR